MKYDMNAWMQAMRTPFPKRPLPLLSFPSVSLLGVTVGEIVTSGMLQARGMQLIAERTNAAAAVSFMDLSVEAECFGARVEAYADEVPTVTERLIWDMDGATALCVPAVGSARSALYIDAIREAATLITDRPVLAGIIGPFSLAARLLDVSEIMVDCYDEPELVHTVLEKTTAFLIEYAKAYKAAGANGVVMAEPVSGLLSPALEAEFSAPYVKRIVDAVQDDSFILVYHNCGPNTPHMVDSLLSCGAAAYHFGNAVDLEAEILAKVPTDTLVMGNIDPAGVLRMGTPDSVRAATLALMERCAKYPNFLLSSGCDIPPMTPWDNIRAFFDASEAFFAN